MPTPDDPTTAPVGPGDGVRAAEGGPTITAGPAERGVARARSSSGSLTIGLTLAGRYRVVRFIARGGMGEVYEVEDELLGGRLALKTILPDLDEDPDAVERFKREILLARRVTHPNICRIHDIGVHHERAAGGGEVELLFLTMELLDGPSLSARVRQGRIPPEEALPIVEQMAAGLAAAHEAGIVHRDFKTANVMLVAPTSSSPSGFAVRAVVTDFGLARTGPGAGSLRTISQAGGVVGTPAYMAPEQVLGQPVTPAVDVYALGVVVYEMVTGVRPFEGESPFSVAMKRVSEAPVAPSVHLPSLDPRWEAVILRCLEREPAARFASARDVAEALRSGVLPPGPAVAGDAHTRPAWRRPAVVALVAGTLAAAGAGVLWLSRETPEKPAPAAASAAAPVEAVRRAVAVLPLANLSRSAEQAWVGTALADLLRADLRSGTGLRVVAPGEVANAARDLGLANVAALPPAQRDAVRARLGADVLLIGTYAPAGGAGGDLLRLDLRLEDARTGKPLGTGSATGSATALADLAGRAAAGLRTEASLGERSPADAAALASRLPSDPKAARLYAEGRVHLEGFDRAGAVERLAKAAALEPTHAGLQEALAVALVEVGEEGRAARAAAKVLELAAGLPDDDRLPLQARAWEISRDWAKAEADWAAALAARPDDLESGLELVAVQVLGGSSHAALVTAGKLRALPAPLGNDPRLDLAEARAHQELNDFARQDTLAARAAKAARDRGDRLILARALLLRSTALLGLGKAAEATQAVEEARGLYEAAGDREGATRCLEQLAAGLLGQGDLEGSRRLYERALALHRDANRRGGAARTLVNLAAVLGIQGRSAESEKLQVEALETFRKAGDSHETASTLNNLGASFLARGDLAGALARYREALALWSDLGQKGFTAMALTNIGEVLRLEGDLAGARGMHEEALATNRTIGEKAGAAWDLLMLAEVFLLRGDLGVARQRVSDAAALQAELKDRLGTADGRLLLSRAALADGKADVALAEARAADEVFRAEDALARAAAARGAAAEALLALGKPAEAAEEAAEAEKLASQRSDHRGRLAASVVAARVAAARGGTEARTARPRLEEALAAAKKSGLVPLWLEGRLARAELARATGDDAAARREATEVERLAREKDLGLLVRQARGLGAGAGSGGAG